MEDVRKEKPHCVPMCLILEHRIEKGKNLILFLIKSVRTGKHQLFHNISAWTEYLNEIESNQLRADA
jgi:hypothetical protein